MKKLTLFSAAVLFLTGTSLPLFAQQNLKVTTPRTISYQGLVLDAAKKPVTGSHHVRINLYDSPLEGSLLHTESFDSKIESGVLSVLIGSEQALESTVRFDKQYWIGLSIDQGSELTPRTALTSVPYALHAEAAASLSKGATGAVTTMNGKSGDLFIKGGAGTLVQSEGNTITITALPIQSGSNEHALATTVNSITGTANQVLANGLLTKQSGDVTLTLPQNIGTGSSVTFGGLTIGGTTSLTGTTDINNSGGSATSIGNTGTATLKGGTVNIQGGGAGNPNINIGTNTFVDNVTVNGHSVSINSSNVAADNGPVTVGNTTNGGDVTLNANIASNTIALRGFNITLNNSAGGTLQFSNLGTGILHSNGAGNISSSAINLANADVTGVLNEPNGGTSQNSYVRGDMLYASGVNTLAKRAIGATGTVLAVTGGVPTWTALSGLGVTSVAGTASQILVNGVVGSQTGAVTLSLPASPVISGLTLSNFGTAGLVHNNASGSLSSSLLVNNDVSSAAAIAYSKLNLNGALLGSDISSGANVAYSKLNLTNSVTNADISPTASIAYSKLNLTGHIVNADVAVGANVVYSKLNLTSSIVNADIAAGAGIPYSKLNLTNSITTGDIVAGTLINSDISGSAAIADTKLATIATAGKVSNSATTATSANTANTIVSRDGSGNFSAGTITATLNGNATNVSGTIQETHGGTGITTYAKGDMLYASAANTLSKRAIGAAGQVLTVSNGVPVWSALTGVGVTSLTGTANQVLVNGDALIHTGALTLTLPQDMHSGASPTFIGLTLSGLSSVGVVHNSLSGVLSTSLIVDADISGTAAISNSKLATIVTAGKVANSATTATASNVNNAIVARDASGNFSAGSITLSGNATSASTLTTDPAITLTTKDYVDNIASEYWNMGGNIGASSDTHFIGTNDDNDFSFHTNGVEHMKITSSGSLLLSGTSGDLPASGNGTRMMWIPTFGAFRAGQAYGGSWNSGTIGTNSVAMGYGTLADGYCAIAMGYSSAADGTGASAFGSAVYAMADGSTAMGSGSQAGGINSVALGDNATAIGVASVSIGSGTVSNTDYSVTFGRNVTVGNMTNGTPGFGYNSGSNSVTMDLSGMATPVAYFGDADMLIGNDDNSARALKLFGPNSSTTLTGAFSTAFKAQTQSADITYTLPPTQGTASSILSNNGSGMLSWSALSDLNVPTGSGTTNNIALWSSTSTLVSGSNLYYNSTTNNFGIGTSSPTVKLDVSGDVNISGIATTNGLAMTSGSAILSYSTVQASAAITIPNVAVVKITSDGLNLANVVTMPTGTNGQIIYIYNDDAQALSGDITLPGSTMGAYVYVDGWRKAN